MKLIKLQTTNFKKLGSRTINFSSGLNIISGENYVGKTTLLQAIESSLYGVTVIAGKKESIPTWGTDKFVVELTFSIGEDIFTVTRSKSTAKLLRNGELEANGSTPVTEHITELLQMSNKDFNIFVQSRQGETAGVLTFGATALSAKIEEYSGAKLIDSITSKASKKASELKAQSAILLSTVSDDLQLDKLIQSKEQKDSELSELLVQLESLVEPSESIDVYLQRKYLAQVKAEYDSLEYTDIQDVSEKIDSVESQIRKVNSELLKANKSNSEYELLTKQLSDVKHDIENLVSVEQSDYQHEEQQLTLLRVEYKSTSELLKNAKCPTCGTVLCNHNPDELSEQLSQIESDAEKIKVVLEEKKLAKEKYDRYASKRNSLLASLVSINKSLEGKSIVDTDELSKSLEILNDSRNVFLIAAHNQDKAKKANLKKAKLEKELVGYVESDVSHEYESELRNAWSEYKSAKLLLSAQVSSCKADIDKIVSDIKRAEGFEKVKLQANELSKKAELSSELSKFLKKRRTDYMADTWNSILAFASKHVAYATQGDISEIGYNDGFTYIECCYVNAVTSASGAQKAFIGTALRIALSKVLYGDSSLLILDEPTESMSEKSASNLCASLVNCAQQILLITHREKDQSLADNVVSL